MPSRLRSRKRLTLLPREKERDEGGKRERGRGPRRPSGGEYFCKNRTETGREKRFPLSARKGALP